MIGFCCCTGCTATVVESWLTSPSFTYWSPRPNQMTVAVAITYPGAVGVGCPGNTTNWVLKPSGALGNPTTFRRWRNDDGLDVELIATVNGSNNFVAQYVRVWKTTGEEVIADKSSGTWKVSGNCVNYTPPCNFIISIFAERFLCLRPAANAPFSATMSGSNMNAVARVTNCGSQGNLTFCDPTPVDFFNNSYTITMPSMLNYADGLVYPTGGSITGDPPPMSGCTRGISFGINPRGLNPSVGGSGSGCTDEIAACSPGVLESLCGGSAGGNLNLTSNTTQGWESPFNQTATLTSQMVPGGPNVANGNLVVNIP